MIEENIIKVLKPCIKTVTFNRDDIIIETFYPQEFRKNFPLTILFEDNDKMEIYKDKYIMEVFTIEVDFYETFMKSFYDAIMASRDDIRKSLLLETQLKRLSNIGFGEMLQNKSIQLEEGVVTEIMNMDTFDYENELYDVWDDLVKETSSNTNPDLITGYNANNFISEPTPPVITFNNETGSMTQAYNYDGGMMVTPMSDIEDDYSDFDAPEGYDGEIEDFSPNIPNEGY